MTKVSLPRSETRLLIHVAILWLEILPIYALYMAADFILEMILIPPPGVPLQLFNAGILHVVQMARKLHHHSRQKATQSFTARTTYILDTVRQHSQSRCIPPPCAPTHTLMNMHDMLDKLDMFQENYVVWNHNTLVQRHVVWQNDNLYARTKYAGWKQHVAYSLYLQLDRVLHVGNVFVWPMTELDNSRHKLKSS